MLKIVIRRSLSSSPQSPSNNPIRNEWIKRAEKELGGHEIKNWSTLEVSFHQLSL